MRDAIIIAPSELSLKVIADIISESHVTNLSDEGLRLWVKNREIGAEMELVKDQSLSQYYDEEDVEIINKIDFEPVYYMVTFKEVDALRRLLKKLDGHYKIIVDNDFGMIDKLSKFNERWEKNSDWDWFG
nr:hypothetical protein [uncultured Sphingomonas sp.]